VSLLTRLLWLACVVLATVLVVVELAW